ncbi:beta-phosphoglucomutase [Carnobacterium maltaromaticum]|uniref:beta-phosphoglucomutase n=1 Tax=Carnobacterium maltaromaticum TaxID=2751 RepID=UPI00295EB8ED|nr:beta-phosphoglucomutase [Carnobacterium maltaromaticum]
MIKGFIFDLDGVITDTAEYHFLAWQELAKGLGIQIDRSFNEKLKGISRLESLETILDYGDLATMYTPAEKIALATEKNTHYIELIQNITPVDLLPGISQLLHDLKEQHFKIALASASKNGPFILDKLEISSFFDAIVDPETLTNGKPDPEVFIKAAQFINLPVTETVGIEDAEAGIISINSAGMFSVGVGNPESMKNADYLVTDTAQLSLAKILEKANKN